MRPRTSQPGILNLLTLVLAAALLLWPALLNRYPILYSDTGGMLDQALYPSTGWDKPWVYGPFLTPFHLRQTLWPAVAAQSLILSAAVWLAQAAIAPPSRIRHLVVCAILAATTAAPWFASLLMPDVFTAITVLGLFVLATPGPVTRHPGNLTLVPVAIVTTIAIASHLAHLVLAAACIAALALLRWRSLLRTAPPLAAALALLVVTNLASFGIPSVSPYGADFALARLVADGPARTVIDRECPASGWRICAYRDRLTDDSDRFLWDPESPVWADGFGPTLLAPEAAAIVRTTILALPRPVLHAAILNTYRQFAMTTLGDTLTPLYLDVAVEPALELYFPPAEAARFRASRQAADTLAELAAPLDHVQQLVLMAGTLGSAALALFAWRRPPLATLAILALVALFANAFATGALSGPHDRYQARLAWIVVIPPLFALTRLRDRTGVEAQGATKPPSLAERVG